MSEVLILVDHVEGEIKKATFELLTAARALGSRRRWWWERRTRQASSSTRCASTAPMSSSPIWPSC